MIITTTDLATIIGDMPDYVFERAGELFRPNLAEQLPVYHAGYVGSEKVEFLTVELPTYHTGYVDGEQVGFLTEEQAVAFVDQYDCRQTRRLKRYFWACDAALSSPAETGEL